MKSTLPLFSSGNKDGLHFPTAEIIDLVKIVLWICNMQYALCDIQYPQYNHETDRCNLKCAICNMQYAIYNIRNLIMRLTGADWEVSTPSTIATLQPMISHLIQIGF